MAYKLAARAGKFVQCVGDERQHHERDDREIGDAEHRAAAERQEARDIW